MSETVASGANLQEKHKDKLTEAGNHVIDLACWSGLAEIPSEKIYGEGSKQAGEDAFKSQLGNKFTLEGHAGDQQVSGERSPYGIDLDISYPAASTDRLLQNATAASIGWANADPERRAAVLLEALERLSKRSFESAHAVMHTTGQAFMMAFQAGAAHALDRALEAVAAATQLQNRWPRHVRWEKPQGKRSPIVVDKRYNPRPRGISVVIGCNTFPTWNAYPGIFASLACGNPVIVKPHPMARLPLAIAVQELRTTLAEAGFAMDVAQLAVDTFDEPVAKELATDPRVALVDYTGSSVFGQWLEQNCAAHVFAEKSGRNSVLVADFDDIKGMANNLALSLCLYSGQMCTSPQDIHVVASSKTRFEEVSTAIVSAIEGLLADENRAVEILGAIANQATIDSLTEAAKDNEVVLQSRKVTHPAFPDARVHTPAILRPSEQGGKHLQRELFGPMSVLYEAVSFEKGLAEVAGNAKTQGALSALVYSDDEAMIDSFESECARAGVNTAANLTGAAIVNHSAAFSDFHGTGANPAASASLTDLSFIAPRFFVHEKRRQGS